MNKGDKRAIYQDPLTEQKPEGTATLLRRVSREDPAFNGRRVEHWTVHFECDDPDQTVTRRILAD